jgi:hypothetical protein
MSVPKRAVANSFLGVNRTTWLIFSFAIMWCCAFYLMRQPQKPFAFDLPQAQGNFSHISPWSKVYPSTIFNCGTSGMFLPSCANYCDPQSRVRYVECTAP